MGLGIYGPGLVKVMGWTSKQLWAWASKHLWAWASKSNVPGPLWAWAIKSYGPGQVNSYHLEKFRSVEILVAVCLMLTLCQIETGPDCLLQPFP